MVGEDKQTKVVILAGPTASGKSALALDLAATFNGSIINADSMQVYRDLPILTAQPHQADITRTPHRLYGFLNMNDFCDAQRWARLAATEIDAELAVGRLPIVVGGTGLYLRALMTGFSPMPEISPDIRNAARLMVEQTGAQEMHRRLAQLDPETAVRLNPNDRQRISRAWEVLEETGKPLSDWQKQPPIRLTTHSFFPIIVMPDRANLYAAINARFAAMVANGALDEVKRAETMAKRGESGGRKALGYRELVQVIEGKTTLEDALSAAQQSTRHYAKRQLTWFRHQMPDAYFISHNEPCMKFSQSYMAQISQKIRNFLLTP